MSIAVLAESGTAPPFSCFAIGALIADEAAFSEIGTVARRFIDSRQSRWDEATPSGIAAVTGAIRELLAAARRTDAEFRVIVCRKEDFKAWNRGRERGMQTAWRLLEENLRRGPTTRLRAAPSIADGHVGRRFGLGDAGLVDVVPTSVRSTSLMRDTQELFSAFVAAIMSDTHACLRTLTDRDPAVELACAAIAGFIGVDALRNDTWPTYEQRVDGAIRHNVWHFPEGFRGSPGMSQSIQISV